MTRRVSAGGVSPFLVLLGLVVLGGSQSGCSTASSVPIEDEAKTAGKTKADFPADDSNYFSQMDQVPGAVAGQLQPLDLTPEQIRGRNTWMLWTGGNEAFWDWLANYNPGFIDLLKLVDFNPERQWRRFEKAGLIVEPETRVPVTADRYGLHIRQRIAGTAKTPDEFRFGRSSGIVGLRLYGNPKFDAAAASRWDVKRYYDDPSYYLDPSLVRPYRVGMSCAFCHVGPHPLSPPANVEEPLWSNLSATIGSQYLRTRAVFGNLLKPDNYFYHLLDSQLPGTLDTSLIPSDNINNANAENAIFELGGRLDRSGVFSHRPNPKEYEQEYLQRYGTNSPETVGEVAARWPGLFSTEPTTSGSSTTSGSYESNRVYANPRPVPRVLMDGSDSVGPWAALARVYLNIGTYHQRWVTLHNPLFGFTRPKPFTMVDAAQHSVYWVATEALMDDLARYLAKASSPMRLKDAPNGTTYVKGGGVPWAPELAAGQQVFASHCIVCHSSKQPKMFDETPANQVLTLLSNPDYERWAEAEVKTREFWQDNYLSTDRRLPVTLVETNAARALGSNGIAGSMWEEFSSKTYKDLPSAGTMRIWNPFRRQSEDVKLPAGGRGYYRPPTLVSVWATAPFLHNNSVGNFNNDPSVEGRVRAFNDAIAKLLVSGPTKEEAEKTRWELGSNLNGATPDRVKNDHGVIWRLPHDARLRIPANQLPLLVASTFSLSPALVGQPWLTPLFVFMLATFSIIAGRRTLRWFGYFLTVLALVAAATQPWIIPLFVFALAAFFIFAGRRLIRRLGYLLTGLAFVVAGLSFFAAGRVVDLPLRLPRELPVNLVANLDFERLDNEGTWTSTQRVWRIGKALVKVYWPSTEKSTENPSAYKPTGKPGEDPAFTPLDTLGAELDAINKNRDHVMDRGHYVGAPLTGPERRDLIDLLLTF